MSHFKRRRLFCLRLAARLSKIAVCSHNTTLCPVIWSLAVVTVCTEHDWSETSRHTLQHHTGRMWHGMNEVQDFWALISSENTRKYTLLLFSLCTSKCTVKGCWLRGRRQRTEGDGTGMSALIGCRSFLLFTFTLREVCPSEGERTYRSLQCAYSRYLLLCHEGAPWTFTPLLLYPSQPWHEIVQCKEKGSYTWMCLHPSVSCQMFALSQLCLYLHNTRWHMWRLWVRKARKTRWLHTAKRDWMQKDILHFTYLISGHNTYFLGIQIMW